MVEAKSLLERAAQEIVNLVEEYSSPDLSKALGHHAESLFALAEEKTRNGI
ncbi:MAG: hypothetical protein M3Y72_14710 [Acidobacteriota bacterium]|nr:hypothetical protein [Acidobacteriota bacterium]